MSTRKQPSRNAACRPACRPHTPAPSASLPIHEATNATANDRPIAPSTVPIATDLHRRDRHGRAPTPGPGPVAVRAVPGGRGDAAAAPSAAGCGSRRARHIRRTPFGIGEGGPSRDRILEQDANQALRLLVDGAVGGLLERVEPDPRRPQALRTPWPSSRRPCSRGRRGGSRQGSRSSGTSAVTSVACIRSQSPDFVEAILPRHRFTFSSGVYSGNTHDRRKIPGRPTAWCCVVPTPSGCIALSRTAS